MEHIEHTEEVEPAEPSEPVELAEQADPVAEFEAPAEAAGPEQPTPVEPAPLHTAEPSADGDRTDQAEQVVQPEPIALAEHGQASEQTGIVHRHRSRAVCLWPAHGPKRNQTRL